MHAEAMYFLHHHLARFATVSGIRVLEFGSRNINGTTRDIFLDADYYGVDIEDGEGVDEVADAAHWTRESMPAFDIVICAEVFEHTRDWPKIVESAFEALATGGVFVCTAAAPDREPHSAVNGDLLADDHTEYYCNVRPDDLKEKLEAAGFTVEGVAHNKTHGDVYAVAWKHPAPDPALNKFKQEADAS